MKKACYRWGVCPPLGRKAHPRACGTVYENTHTAHTFKLEATGVHMTQSNESGHYARLGVDAGKSAVRKVFGALVDNDFPGAFVNIVRHPERTGEVFTSHMDGDGSKMIQRVLNFREHGDPCIFRGAADDALSMNTGDIAAAGFTRGLLSVTDILNVNGFKVPKQIVMQHIGERIAELRDLYRRVGFNIFFLGGETADLPHQVQTIAFDVNVHATAYECDLILGRIKPGDRIWGLASDGKAAWEDTCNSGIMSNGLTLARTCLMSREYTVLHSDLVRQGGTYEGAYRTGDSLPTLGGMTLGTALTSPTRQWAIVLKILFDDLREAGLLHLVHGITMNTGGGATKLLHLGTGGINFQKCMPNPPPLFHIIQREAQETWRNMYETFNCGIGIDIVGDERLAPHLDALQHKTDVALHTLGACVPSNCNGNTVTLNTSFGEFVFQ